MQVNFKVLFFNNNVGVSNVEGVEMHYIFTCIGSHIQTLIIYIFIDVWIGIVIGIERLLLYLKR